MVSFGSITLAGSEQVYSDGDVRLVSGVGAKGTSYMTLGGGKGLGPDEAQQLARLLQKTQLPLLSTLDLRYFSLFECHMAVTCLILICIVT